MKHFKDIDNKVWAFASDGSQDTFILDGLTPITNEEAAAITSPPLSPPSPEQIATLRRAAYEAQTDPLFFKSQRGEATTEEWLAKIAEIKARYP